MKRTNVVLLLLMSLLIAENSAHAFGRSRPRPSPTPTPTPVTYNYTADELQGIELINQHRLSMGLSGITKNDFISTQCLSHNNYMIQKNKPSHDYFTSRADAIKKRINAIYVGEIVAYNYISQNGVVSAWLNSDGHRQAIENPRYRRVGYSVRANAQGRKFFTMIFSD